MSQTEFNALNSISIHASAKEATRKILRSSRRPLFQSTPPRRRRPSNLDIAQVMAEFQSTPPRRRRRRCAGEYRGRSVFQSTPPRRRRPEAERFSDWVTDISIHASAKEATAHEKTIIDFDSISIHASAKEATGLLELFRLGVENFNPRLREGGDA